MKQAPRAAACCFFSIVMVALPQARIYAGGSAGLLPERLVGIGSVEPEDELNGDGVVDAADVVSLMLGPVGLTITSTTPAAAVSAERLQVLTFQFDRPVQGFTDSDVTLVGATKVDFGGEGDQFWMVVEGIGGTVTAEVPFFAVKPDNVGASFSNFYQDTWTLNLPGSVPLELIRIPAGTFMMGSPAGETSRKPDETQHAVTLSQDFYLGKTEVTQDQWAALQSFPLDQSFAGGTMPVHNVLPNFIDSWLTALNTHVTGPGTFSLPTESQWEYACRAGTTTRFNFGEGFGADENCSAEAERTGNMWYCGNNSGSPPTPTYGTKPVGQKPANAWGPRDMHGNVWEWCADWYGAYPAGPVTDPTGPATGPARVIRGGSWLEDARFCRSAERLFATGQTFDFGFRVLGVRPVPLTITSTETAPVHQSATQTLTFTFGSAVPGFDADDITLTGAAKGAFTAVSSSVYTLVVNGNGGTMSASVAATATAVPTPFTGVQAAAFSNFYQDTWTLNLPGSVPLELIRIPAGTFTMGSPETELSRVSDEVQHTVTLTQDFYLGKTEVTQAQWRAIQIFPNAQRYVGDTLPVHNVSIFEINSWLGDVNRRVIDSVMISLPTEAQWEYACRAGSTTRFSFGDGLHPENNEDCGTTEQRTANMWYCGNSSLAGPIPVGQTLPNAWGLWDMHGNMQEVCSDWYGPYSGDAIDPIGPDLGPPFYQVYRGGDWNNVARFCRTAARDGGPALQSSWNGFRIASARPLPLTITSDAADFHQSATQTLTFTFGSAVPGFDADDITLTGAAKGAFTAVSSSVYTLVVNGNGGTMSASVAATATAVPTPFTGVQAVAFSNFYQDTWTITLPGNVPLELIRIPAGSFTMGSPTNELSRGSDETQHTVTLSRDFYIGKTEVTQAQYTALQSSPPTQVYPGGTIPVHNVSWSTSSGWMSALNTHVTEPGTFSLPTESQWEYAARAGTTTRFSFGDGAAADESCSLGSDRETNMWYCGNSASSMQPVGQKAANRWGLFDMHGNAEEWCADWYGTYPGNVTDPTGPVSGDFRVLRGGNYGSGARFCRSAERASTIPALGSRDYGFRVAAVR